VVSAASLLIQLRGVREVFRHALPRGVERPKIGATGRKSAVAAALKQHCGSRNVELEINIEPRIELRADPWNCYFACRFAWGDEDAQVSRSLHETRQKVESGSFEAPQFIEIDNGENRVAVLTGGLPYHRLVDHRMLDSLLIVRGETQRNFRIAIAVCESHPLPAAMAWLAGNVELTGACPTSSSGWLLHVGARNVHVTHLAPLVEQGRVLGFRARLLETAGRAGRTPLTALRPLRSARMLNFLGKSLGDCRIEDGKALVDLSAYEWSEFEARWE
jgi:alpha-mannosidase